jgi:hypothetical protein
MGCAEGGLVMLALVALVWLVGSIAAVVWIVRPVKSWPIVSTRLRALGVFLAIFIGLPIAAAPFDGAFSASADKASASTSMSAKADAAQSAQAQAAQQAAERAREAGEQAQRQLDDMRSNPQNYLSFAHSRAWKSGFDTVFMLSGAIKNSSKLTMKDAEFDCDVSSESDTGLGFVRGTVYKVFPPGAAVSFSDLNLGFVNSNWAKYGCQITGATVVDAGAKAQSSG